MAQLPLLLVCTLSPYPARPDVGFFTPNETFDVGCDTCSPVLELYKPPFAFSGMIVRAMVDISEAKFEDLAAHHEAHARFAMATR